MTHPICQVRVFTADEALFIRLRACLAAGDKSVLDARCRHLSSVDVADGRDGDVFLVEHSPAAGHDGFEVCRQLRARGCHQPVIMLLLAGAENESGRVQAAAALGVSDCLPEHRIDAFTLSLAVRCACAQATAAERAELIRAVVENRGAEAYLLRTVTAQMALGSGRLDADGRIACLYGNLFDDLGLRDKIGSESSASELFPEARELVQRALHGDQVEFPSVIRCAKGERRLRNHVFFDTGRGEGAIFVIRDVTNRARDTELALDESRLQFQTLLERSLDAILLVNDAGVCIEANQAASHLLGYARAQLVGRPVGEIGFEGFAALQSEALNRSPFQGAKKIFQGAYVRPDGESRFLDYAAYRASAHFHLCLLRDRTEQRRLEQELAEVIDLERRRFSQDLHDGLGQHLAGVAYMGDALAARLSAQGADKESREAAAIADLVNGAIGQAREIARCLYPADLAENRLPEMLQQLAESFRTIYHTSCHYAEDCKRGLPPLDSATSLHLYRIAQEAANNAHRHGRARRVDIQLAYRAGKLTLAVEDDGAGFPSAPPASPAPGAAGTGALGGIEPRRGLGLHIMRHRARLLGSTLTVLPGRNACGARITCVLELPRHTLPAAPARLAAATV